MPSKKPEGQKYSLIIAPQTTVARQLGKIRKQQKNSKALFDDFVIKLGLTEEEFLNFEKGKFDGIYNVPFILNKYHKLLDKPLTQLQKRREFSVNIPDSKKEGEFLGGQTYLMAIDAYTTKFKDKNEMLADIRKNGYLNIKETIANDQLWVFLEHPEERKDLKIMYSDNQELIKFISQNKYATRFDYSNPYVIAFHHQIKEAFRSTPNFNSGIEAEYRRYLRNRLNVYGPKMAAIFNWDINYNEDVTFGVAGNYEYIRAHCAINQAYEEEKTILERNMNQSFSEPIEYKMPESKANLHITSLPPKKISLSKTNIHTMQLPLFDDTPYIKNDKSNQI